MANFLLGMKPVIEERKQLKIKSADEEWILSIDEASNKNHVGVGVVL